MHAVIFEMARADLGVTNRERLANVRMQPVARVADREPLRNVVRREAGKLLWENG